MTEAMFRRTASSCAYGIAALSLLYAGVYLGLVRPDPTNTTASALANGFIGISGILATFAVIAIGDKVGGTAGRWLRVVGVGWALLSAAHGVFSAVSDAQGLATVDLSATDPRGFATFGLAGLWSIVLGLAIRSGTSFPRTLGIIALLDGVDLVVLFLATATGAGTLVLITGGLASVILGPLQWAWIGRALTEA
jgi:hypothetical protein